MKAATRTNAITVEEFFSIVRSLANSGFVRYWLNWPIVESKRRLMVLAVINVGEGNVAVYERVADAAAHGMREIKRDGGIYYAVERKEGNEQQI